MPLQELTRELAEQIAADFPALQSLNLSNNALQDVRRLQLLPRSVAQLDLGRNRLQALPAELGTWLPSLRLLRLRGNALESLRPLSGCAQLQTLDAGANRVALVSELRFLQPLTELRHLALDGNPLAKEAACYRREVLAMLPQLQSLDDQPFTAAERLYAKLQLKTQLGLPPAGGSSSGQSPTRLLTPESVSRGGNRPPSSPPAVAALRVEVDGPLPSADEEEEEEDRGWKTRGNLRGHDAGSEGARVAAVGRRRQADEAVADWRLQPWAADDRTLKTQREKPVDSSRGFNGPQQQMTSWSSDVHVSVPTEEVREELLASRVAALEAILAVQDKTMRLALTRFGGRTAGISSVNSTGQSGSSVVPTAEAAAAVYTRLLSTWREKCVALMVQMRSAELEDEARGHDRRQLEVQASEALARREEQLEVWRQRAADLEAQRDLEAVAARQAAEQRSKADEKALQAVRGLCLEREKLQRLAETVALFTSGVMRDKVELLRGGTTRLEALERRLLFAKERVDMSATLVTHREARLRNREAALTAERRVWTSRLQQKRVDKAPAKDQSEGGDEAMVTSTTGGKRLRPATETALRSLFQRLDAYDAGLVRSQTLLGALRLGDAGVLRAVGGPKKLAKLVTHVEAATRKLSLGGGASATLTWGEFLLFFVPESSVSLSELLQDDDEAENGAADSSPVSQARVCSLCAASKSEKEMPSCSLVSAGAEGDLEAGEPASSKARRERRALQTLSHAELVQQVQTLRSDREQLRRRLLRDAHDLRERVLGVRREWEAKTIRLVRQKDELQRASDSQLAAIRTLRQQLEAVEQGRDSAVLECRGLRDRLAAREQEFERRQQQLEAEGAARVRHEHELWQTELQDARLAQSLLQADHSKQQVRVRQLERDLARQKEALLAHESERVASLEDKVRRRDAELARLRRERNAILSSLREQERKLPPAATDAIATQTTEPPPSEQRSVASQTVAASAEEPRREPEDARGFRMSLDEIATPRTQQTAANQTKQPPSRPPAGLQLSPEAVNLRLQKLQSLTEDLLAD
ncbi:hypothetical protein BBJ28_00010815 [Nothophytophthora sp. Chile5]|nr:hypothetical protein BBJ28_00010815 [Nothophytophthora sp. Chile5]